VRSLGRIEAGRFELGGSASDVRIEYRYDPLIVTLRALGRHARVQREA
jgi:hypothetical protein